MHLSVDPSVGPDDTQLFEEGVPVIRGAIFETSTVVPKTTSCSSREEGDELRSSMLSRRPCIYSARNTWQVGLIPEDSFTLLHYFTEPDEVEVDPKTRIRFVYTSFAPRSRYSESMNRALRQAFHISISGS